jgi:disulfide bond formation protein DsbB
LQIVVSKSKIMANEKKRDDEKGQWLAVGILFTGFLIGLDIWYSSYSQMAGMARWGLYVAHIILAFAWVIAMVKFKDPAYDVVRKFIVGFSILLSLIIGIHHATTVEDKAVIDDSNKAKQESAQ